jgi:hypothetical protein
VVHEVPTIPNEAQLFSQKNKLKVRLEEATSGHVPVMCGLRTALRFGFRERVIKDVPPNVRIMYAITTSFQAP